MIAYFYSWLRYCKGKRGYFFLYRCIKLFLNVLYPLIIFFKKPYGCSGCKNGIIVSLTTFPARITKVHLVIETLMHQTMKPEKIILWLAETQFESKDRLPKKLLKLQERGLEIRFCEDLRSHKKYYYSMLYYPEHMIITVDDDTFYPETLIEDLMQTHRKYPDCVCCMLAHKMLIKHETVMPYKQWISGIEGISEPSYLLVPIGCEGVLYPPHILSKYVFEKRTFRQICSQADDLWLKAMSTLNNVKVMPCYTKSITFANLWNAKKFSLNELNVGQNLNDRQLKNLMERYPEILEKWKKASEEIL